MFQKAARLFYTKGRRKRPCHELSRLVFLVVTLQALDFTIFVMTVIIVITKSNNSMDYTARPRIAPWGVQRRVRTPWRMVGHASRASRDKPIFL